MDKCIKYIILVFIFAHLCSSCEKIWTLERFEINSFDTTVNESTVGYNFKNDLIQLDDNSYYMVGTTVDSSILISKLLEDGVLQATFSNFGRGRAHAIAKTQNASNEYVVVGTIDQDMFVMWIDEDGNKLQMDTFKLKINSIIGLVEEIAAYDLVITEAGNYIITGFVKQSIGARRLMWIKLSSNGVFEEFRSLTNNGYGISILEANNETVLISGYQNGRLMLSRVDNDGVLLWQKKIPNSSEEELTNLVKHFNGNYLLIGTRKGTDENVFVLEIDDERNVIWEKEYGNDNSTEIGIDISPTRDSSFVFTALSKSTESSDILLTKIDQFGNVIWESKYDGRGIDKPNHVSQVKDFGFIIFGLNQLNSIVSQRVIKTDEDGETR